MVGPMDGPTEPTDRYRVIPRLGRGIDLGCSVTIMTESPGSRQLLMTLSRTNR